MKKFRSNEQVQNAVGRYLQKRRYGATGDDYRRNTLPTTQSVLQMALKEVLTIEASTNDAIQFSSAWPEPLQIDQQYSKFKVKVFILNTHAHFQFFTLSVSANKIFS